MLLCDFANTLKRLADRCMSGTMYTTTINGIEQCEGYILVHTSAGDVRVFADFYEWVD